MIPRRLLILLLLTTACGGAAAGPNPPPAPPPAPPPPPPPPPPPQPGLTAQVAMGSSIFVPTEVTIQRTGTVTWSNTTGLGHSVTFTAGNGVPADIPVPATGTNSRSFAMAGTFAYLCTVHAGMTGRVVVQ